jgi:hypothetical protein
MNTKYLVIVAVMPAMLVGETALATTDKATTDTVFVFYHKKVNSYLFFNKRFRSD